MDRLDDSRDRERAFAKQGSRRRRVLALAVLAGILAASGCVQDPEERRNELYRLRDDPTPENLDRIRERLSDPNRDVRATALFALVSAGAADAKDRALAATSDEDEFVRSNAAKLLGDLEARDSVPVLVDLLLHDPKPEVRQRCAESLALLGGPEAEAGLVRALEDPLKRVRAAAVGGIVVLNPELAFDALLEIVVDDAEWEIRARAARGLGSTGRIEAVPALETAVEDENEFVRAAAASALRRVKGEEE